MRTSTSSAALAAVLSILPACARTQTRSERETRSEIAPAAAPPAVAPEPGARWTTAVAPKPVSSVVRRGLDWLLEQQHGDGGWSQGEESRSMGNAMDAFRDASDVADTCIAALALIRSGEAFGTGRYKSALERAVEFVCGQIEKADADSLSVTDVNGTRVQAKIGTYVDTFVASLMLSEVQGRLDGESANQRARDTLAKVIRKIEKNQQAGGTWQNEGWAPVLSQSLAGKGLNRAAQAGAQVDRKVLEDTTMFALAGPGDAAVGSSALGGAGVWLYTESSNLGVLQDAVNTGNAREQELRDKIESSKDEDERKACAEELAKIQVFKKACAESQDSVVQRLDDPGFVSGFGSNGGEEFLSYMNISESLVLRGDESWKKWDEGVTANLTRVQNGDGSWTGHHCITGRTFCTSAALLVLMADRTPVPLESAARGG